jgi:hypothetical protein
MSCNVWSVQQHAFGYSSEVKLRLVMRGAEYALSQIGPDFVVLRTPTELPAEDAEVVMIVDGQETRWPVTLCDGAVPYDCTAAIVDR